ncbi:hypothetical protein GGR57DRAFT_48054 [Xylariaceae sp. FL1272]|nr:hypothetical protein GGR57DRAFT_48054 [Xylariaceae sp. FL1272]
MTLYGSMLAVPGGVVRACSHVMTLVQQSQNLCFIPSGSAYVQVLLPRTVGQGLGCEVASCRNPYATRDWQAETKKMVHTLWVRLIIARLKFEMIT